MNNYFRYAVTVVMLVVLFFLSCVEWEVQATSWAELKPQDVIEQSEVVVVGTYDFESKTISSGGIFTGYLFNVNAVYKGEAVEQMTTGIDAFDVGLAKEIQENGGEFLLFLKQQDDADFLVPIAGPNGMIEMKDGEVQGEKGQVYTEFLNSEMKTEPIEDEETETVNFSFLIFGAIAVLIILIGFLRYRKKVK